MALLIEKILIADEHTNIEATFDPVNAIVSPLKSDIFAFRIFLGYFFLGSLLNLDERNFLSRFGVSMVHVEFIQSRLTPAPIFHVSFFQTRGNTTTFIVKSIILNIVETNSLMLDVLCPGLNFLFYRTSIQGPFNIKFFTIEVTSNHKLTQKHRSIHFTHDQVIDLCPKYKSINKNSELYRIRKSFSFITDVQRTPGPKTSFFIGETRKLFKQSIEAFGEVIKSSLIMFQQYIKYSTIMASHKLIIQTAYVVGLIMSLVPLPSKFGNIKIIQLVQTFDLYILVHVSKTQLHGYPLSTPVLISIEPENYCQKLHTTNALLNVTANEVLVLQFNKDSKETFDFSVNYWPSTSGILKTLHDYRFYAKQCDYFDMDAYAFQLIQANMYKFQLGNMDEVISHVLGEVCFLSKNFQIYAKVFEYSTITKDMHMFLVYHRKLSYVNVAFGLYESSMAYVDSKFLSCTPRQKEATMTTIFAFFSTDNRRLLRTISKCVTMKHLNENLRGKIKSVECEKLKQKYARRDYEYDRQASLEIVRDFNEGKFSLPKALLSYMTNEASLTILLNATREYTRFATIYLNQASSKSVIVTAESLSTEPLNLYYDASLNYLVGTDVNQLCLQSDVTYINFISNQLGQRHVLVQKDHSLHGIKCGINTSGKHGTIGAKIHFSSGLGSMEKCQNLNQGGLIFQQSFDADLSVNPFWCTVALSDTISSFLTFVQSRIVNSELMALITSRKLKATPLILSRTFLYLITNSSSVKHQKMRHFFDAIMNMIPDPILDSGQAVTLYYIAFNILYRFSFSIAEREQSIYSVVMPNILVKSARLDTSLTHYFTVLNADTFMTTKRLIVDSIQIYDPTYFLNISREMDEMLVSAKVAKRAKRIRVLDDMFLGHEGMKILNTTYGLGAYIYPTINKRGNGFNTNNTFEVSMYVNNTDYHHPLEEYIDIGMVTCLTRKRHSVKNPDFSGWETWAHEAHSFMELALDRFLGSTFPDQISTQHIFYGCTNTISLLKHPVIIQPQRIKCGQKGTAFFDLRDGVDLVKAFYSEISIFLTGNGFKIFEGGNCDDYFILTGENVEGILDGNGGKDTLDISLFAPNCLTVKLTSFSMEYCGRMINLKRIEEFILRDDQEDVVTANCKVRGIETGAGSSNTLIRFPELKCRYNVKMVLKGSTFVENNALIGDFVYEIRESAKNCPFIIKQCSRFVSHHFVMKSTLLETRLNLNEAEKYVLVQTTSTRLKIHITSWTQFNLTFSDCSIKFKYPNFYGEWERKIEFDLLYDILYYQILVLKRIHLIVVSIDEKMAHILPCKPLVKHVRNRHISEVLTIMPHRTFETVIHLPLSNSLIVLNHKSKFTTIQDAVLPDVTIKLSEATSMFDHTLVIKYYVETLSRHLNLSPEMHFEIENNNSVAITLKTENSSGEPVKLVKLRLVPDNISQLLNFRIAKNGLLKFELNNFTTEDSKYSITLTSVPLYFSTSTNFIVVSADDIEENGTLVIDYISSEMHFLKFTTHLLAVNFKKSINDMRAIVLWSFFTRKIFRTIRIKFRDQTFALTEFMENKSALDTLYFQHTDNARWLSAFCRSKTGTGHFVELCDQN